MSKEQDRATARPWVVDPQEFDLIRVLKDRAVCQVFGDGAEQTKANAALIVRAVNSHDKLVEACEAATNKLAESIGLVGVPMYAKVRKNYEADMLDIIREARAALALAREEVQS